MIGRGKYDRQLTAALQSASASQGILVVFDGPEGAGFSVQCTSGFLQLLPELLRSLAESIECDRQMVLGSGRLYEKGADPEDPRH